MGVTFDFPLPEYNEYRGPEFYRRFADIVEGLYVLAPGEHLGIGMSPPSINLPEFSVYQKSYSFWEIKRRQYLGASNICCKIKTPFYYQGHDGRISTSYIKNSSLYTCSPHVLCSPEHLSLCEHDVDDVKCRIGLSRIISIDNNLKLIQNSWHFLFDEAKKNAEFLDHLIFLLREHIYKQDEHNLISNDIKINPGNENWRDLLTQLERLTPQYISETDVCNDPNIGRLRMSEMSSMDWVRLKHCGLEKSQINIGITNTQQTIPEIDINSNGTEVLPHKPNSNLGLTNKLNFTPNIGNTKNILLFILIFATCAIFAFWKFVQYKNTLEQRYITP